MRADKVYFCCARCRAAYSTVTERNLSPFITYCPRCIRPQSVPKDLHAGLHEAVSPEKAP
jgi:hypothetical protein